MDVQSAWFVDESAIPSFVVWVALTGMLMAAAGFSYRAYQRRSS